MCIRDRMKCCTEAWTLPNESPFRRFLATGYYDGPTEGVTSCSVCGQGYSFVLLVWDDAQDIRVFGFSEIDQNEQKVAEAINIALDSSKPVTIVPPLDHELDNRFKQITMKERTHLCVSNNLPGCARLWR